MAAAPNPYFELFRTKENVDLRAKKLNKEHAANIAEALSQKDCVVKTLNVGGILVSTQHLTQGRKSVWR